MEMKRAARFRAAMHILIFLNFATSSVFAQTSGGTILGKIADPSGAILPGVAVTIKNVATGITRFVLTNESGSYNAANLQPGPYEVLAELPSFTAGHRKDISLNVGNEIVIDLVLQIEGGGEIVDVTAQDSKIDLVAATVNRTVEGSTIR